MKILLSSLATWLLLFSFAFAQSIDEPPGVSSASPTFTGTVNGANAVWSGQDQAATIGIGTATLGTNAKLAVNGGLVVGSYGSNATAAPSNGLAVSGQSLFSNSTSVWGSNVEISSASGTLAMPEFSADANGAYVTISKSRGTINVNNAVQNGDIIGGFIYDEANGTNYQQAAEILAKVDSATISTTSAPGRFEFYTTPVSSVTPTLAMTLNSSQHVFLPGVPSGSLASFYTCFDPSSSPVGELTYQATNCTTSLRSTKHSIAPYATGLSDALALQPSTFYMNENDEVGQHREIGLIAEDTEKVNPDLAGYDKGKLKTVQYDRTGVVAIAAIKEMQKEIDELREAKGLSPHGCNWLCRYREWLEGL